MADFGPNRVIDLLDTTFGNLLADESGQSPTAEEMPNKLPVPGVKHVSFPARARKVGCSKDAHEKHGCSGEM